MAGCEQPPAGEVRTLYVFSLALLAEEEATQFGTVAV
jgi:hypothetical protein